MNYSPEEMYEILQAAYRSGELENGKPVLLYSDDNGVDVYATEDESMTGFAKLHLFVNNELMYEFVSFVELFKDDDMCFDPDIEELGENVNWLVHEIAGEDYPDWVFLPDGTETEDDYTTDELNELVDDRTSELMAAFAAFLDAIGIDIGAYLKKDPYLLCCMKEVLGLLSYALDVDIYFPGWVTDENGDQVFSNYALGEFDNTPYIGGCEPEYNRDMTTTERLEGRMLSLIGVDDN